MMRAEHLIADPRACYRAEPAVRDFVLGRSDTFTLTATSWSEGRDAVSRGGFQDEEFQRAFTLLEPDLLETKTTNSRYAGISQPGQAYTHFKMRLSPRLRALFGRQSLLWGHGGWGELYGFEDPAFYSSESGFPSLICNVVSHEPIFYLYLTDDEFGRLLEASGTRWEF